MKGFHPSLKVNWSISDELVDADLSSYLPPSTVHMSLHPDELMRKMAIQQSKGSDGISGRIVVLKCKCGSISVFATLIN